MINYNRSKSKKTVNSQNGYGNVHIMRILNDGRGIGMTISGAQIYFYVDTNGYAKPNRLGFDIFVFKVSKQDAIEPVKMSKLYTEEELEGQAYPDIAGLPCSIKSDQISNGFGCAYYAMNDINPDNEKSGYWKNLPK